MKLVKESLLEFYKPTSVKNAANVGLINVIKKEMENDGEIFDDIDNALGWAAGKNKINYVKYLFDEGANIHADYDYAIEIAAKNGYYDMAT